MPDVGRVLKEEIQRLARKEARDALNTVQRENRELRVVVAELRRRVATLERSSQTAAASRHAVAPPVSESASVGVDESALGARISSRMIKGIRDRLGLTQAALAALLDVSAQTVYQWERKNGPLQLRGRTKAAVVEVRGLGKREAMRRLGMSAPAGSVDETASPQPEPAELPQPKRRGRPRNQDVDMSAAVVSRAAAKDKAPAGRSPRIEGRSRK